MIQLSQRHRAGLQFLGSLQMYSSSQIRDRARKQFAETDRAEGSWRPKSTRTRAPS